MTKHIYLITMTMLLLLIASCMKDLGNYEYRDINEIGISGIENSYEVLVGDHLVIRPELSFTQDDDKDPERYTYEWYTSDYHRVDLGTTRNLDAQISLTPGDHEAHFRVTDQVTGVQWSKSFNINVQTSTYEGWMLLCDVDGTARLDMISLIRGEYIPIQDVLAYTGSALELEGAPVDLAFTHYLATPNQRIYVTAKETGTTSIDSETFAWEPEYYLSYETLMSVPDKFGADFIQANGFMFSSYMWKDGNIYHYNGLFGMRYSLPVNIMAGDVVEFQTAPFIASGFNMLASMQNSVFYDSTNKRFVRHSATGSNCTPMPAGTLFNYETGMDMVYMTENSYNNGQIFAILRNPVDSKYYLARMNSANGSYTQSYWDEMSATDLHLAEHFAVSPEYGYIFYNVGSKLYQYDMSLKQSKLMMDTAPNQISLLRFRIFYLTSRADLSTKLLLGTYDPSGPAASNGIFEMYTVPPVNQALELDERYTGFGKIVDVEYRER